MDHVIPQMFTFYHKENYSKKGVWPTASEKDGKRTVAGQDS